ncbi:hypothetical protein CIHG_08172 [Coccidioides immitis H538.4]|uniref:Uncharacterized protein n=1 Tax=Coccidioides immitis H538.4 TaxID=396776 RepID=A0A0J8RZT9_COCIT|nr:hypothetical protein CIHG_08172 [Coccidioides immitis H538.4]
MHTASPTLDAEEEGLCDEWPPSSPFQEMVSGDLTGLTRDMAPRKDGSGSPKGENPGEDDVNMDREDFKPDEPPVPTMEHAPIMADITFTDEQKDVIIHYRSEPVQVRKVSGMTVNHEKYEAS